MKKQELQELLKRAQIEIRDLRHHNEVMSARLEMFDAVQRMLNSDLNHPSRGITHIDVLYELEKAADSLNCDTPESQKDENPPSSVDNT